MMHFLWEQTNKSSRDKNWRSKRKSVLILGCPQLFTGSLVRFLFMTVWFTETCKWKQNRQQSCKKKKTFKKWEINIKTLEFGIEDFIICPEVSWNSIYVLFCFIIFITSMFQLCCSNVRRHWSIDSSPVRSCQNKNKNAVNYLTRQQIRKLDATKRGSRHHNQNIT